jgi:hypothetical protein
MFNVAACETLHTPTTLAPYLASEHVRVRYVASLTLCEVSGQVDSGAGYVVRVSRHAKRRVRVTWAENRARPQASYETCQTFRWTKLQGVDFTTEAAALGFARAKLEALRAAA